MLLVAVHLSHCPATHSVDVVEALSMLKALICGFGRNSTNIPPSLDYYWDSAELYEISGTGSNL